MAKSLGRVGFITACPNSEVSLDMSLNCRTNGCATPIFLIKKETVKIEARNLHRLSFESENFRNLSIEQLNKIVAYHGNLKGSLSEDTRNKALKELQFRQVQEPKPEIEIEAIPEQKSLLRRALMRVRGVFS